MCPDDENSPDADFNHPPQAIPGPSDPSSAWVLPSELPEQTEWLPDLKKRNPEKGLRYLKWLSTVYDKYLSWKIRNIISTYVPRDKARSEAFIEQVTGDFKIKVFFPDEAKREKNALWIWNFNPDMPGSRLRRYITGAAYNYCRDALEKKDIVRGNANFNDILLNFAEIPRKLAVNDLRHDKIYYLDRAVDAFRRASDPTSNAWRAFELFDLSGRELTQAQVAGELGIPRATVATHIKCARKRIMQLIWDVFRETAASDSEADDDMQALFGAIP